MTETLVRKKRFRGIGLAALLACAVAVVSAGPAAAAEKSLTYKGGFPLIGDQQVTVVVKADIPATATAGTPVSVPFSLDVDAGQAAGDGLRLVGATKVSGSIKSQVNVAIGGQSVAIPIELPIPETPVPAEGSLKFTAQGQVDFTVPAGTPAGEATSSVDAAATTHVVTDSGLGEFDVALTLDPPDQDATLGTTTVS
ncbi:hypothetical protein SAMN05421837_101808 [Amycolatopsis pretoriensis]|uniref:DUF6801 domain-containing protein n=1 Tax=Amycolatopsis pretoriensis TaxID=218821 RepID=A0A1H5Q7F1_9PSEU|nr:DUF6801 domain-containing protein [Amycolatopsis pretoriensis]SEF21308.1 hypothetical protein SAMN05421837_101808 [Amycolatopsis pretoriensis]